MSVKQIATKGTIRKICEDLNRGSEFSRLWLSLDNQEEADKIVKTMNFGAIVSNSELLSVAFGLLVEHVRRSKEVSRNVDVDSLVTYIVSCGISYDWVAAFYFELSKVFRQYNSKKSAEYVYTSFLFAPLEVHNDLRLIELDKVEKEFFIEYTKIHGGLDDFEPIWSEFREKLLDLRKEIYEFLLLKEACIKTREIRNKFNVLLREWVGDLSQKVIDHLTKYTSIKFIYSFSLIGVGTSSLNYLTAFSDLDIALLIDDKADKNHESFIFFLRLLEHKLFCIGEGNNKSLDGKKIAGVMVDAGDIGKPEFIDNPNKMAQYWFERRYQQGTTNPEATAMIKAVMLKDYTKPNQEGLTRRYLDALVHEWEEQKCYQEMLYSMLTEHMKYCECQVNVLKAKIARDEPISFKEGLLRPVLLWLCDVSYMLGFFNAISVDEMLDCLYKSGYFEKDFIDHISNSIEVLWTLKFTFEYEGRFFNDYDLQLSSLDISEQTIIHHLLHHIVSPLVKNYEIILCKFISLSIQRKKWIDKVSHMDSIDDENFLLVTNPEESLISTFDCELSKVDKYSVSVKNNLIKIVDSDLIYFKHYFYSNEDMSFCNVLTEEGQNAFWLRTFPSIGYDKNQMAHLWESIYSSPNVNSQFVKVILDNEVFYCLSWIRNTEQQWLNSKISTKLFTVFLLRTLLIDNHIGFKLDGYLIYFLPNINRYLDESILKCFVRTGCFEVMLDIWDRANEIQFKYDEGIISRGDHLSNLYFLRNVSMNLKNKIKNRYACLCGKINDCMINKENLTGMDLLFVISPDFQVFCKKENIVGKFHKNQFINLFCEPDRKQENDLLFFDKRTLIEEEMSCLNDFCREPNLSLINNKVHLLYNQSFLHVISKHAQPADVLAFIKSQDNFDINFCGVNNAGWTILHYISSNKKRLWKYEALESFFQLISSPHLKAMLTAYNFQGLTPFHYIVQNKQNTWGSQAIQLVLNALGEDVQRFLLTPDKYNKSFFHDLLRNYPRSDSYEIRQKLNLMMGYLSREMVVELMMLKVRATHCTILHIAAYYCHLDLVQELISILGKEIVINLASEIAKIKLEDRIIEGLPFEFALLRKQDAEEVSVILQKSNINSLFINNEREENIKNDIDVSTKCLCAIM